MQVVQWYPGHMAKALRLMKEKLDLIEIVFEIVDARIPFSSSNPYVAEIVKNKPKVVLLNKEDKASKEMTKKWIAYFKENGIYAISINSLNGDGIERIVKTAKLVLKEKRLKDNQKGIKEKAIRALIVGIPNVGKSTLINRLSKRKATKVGDRPGITKSEQWVKVGKELELLDTPGVLWNKFEDPKVGYHLALTGAIKDDILPIDDVVIYGINYFLEHKKETLYSRYSLEDVEDPIEILDMIGLKRGAKRGKEIDYNRVYQIFLKDLRQGHLGKVTFDSV